MSFRVPIVLLTAGLTAAADPAGNLRLVVEKVGDSAWPATVGMVEICPSPATAGGRFSVTTSDGKPVQAQTVWSAAGEPMLVRFNTSSGATKYFFDFNSNAVPASGSWAPEAGVWVETRPCTPGAVNKREEVKKVMSAAGPVQGRSFTPNIYLGMNPHGPSADYVALFTGWFNAPTSGEYAFATISTDASYLEVDGHLVAEWLGRHDPHGGRRGEHSGKIALRPGAHRIDYVQIQFNGEPAAEAAWKLPDQDRYEVMPASAFAPVARFHIIGVDAAGRNPGQLYCHWQTPNHTRLGDTVWLKTRFRAFDPGQGWEFRWRFDDGAEASGASIQHCFLEPGSHQVGVSAWRGGTCVVTNAFKVRAMPSWLQREDWREDVYNEAKNELLHRDLSSIPAREVEMILEWGVYLDDQQVLLALGESVPKRAEELDAAGKGVILYQLGLNLQHLGDRGDRLAEQNLRLAIAAQRLSPTTKEKSRLRLADLLLHCTGRIDEAAKLLPTITGNGLSADERRLWKLLEADLLLAQGKVEAARALYTAVPELAGKGAVKVSFDHAARLESASIQLQCAQFDDALRALDLLVYERPLERLALDTGLLRINVSLKRQEYPRAYTAARTLLPLAEGDPRKSSLLHTLVEGGLILGKQEEAQRALTQLIKEFPYSEAAAKAKDEWGGHLPKGR